MISDTYTGDIKESGDEDDDIITSDSTLHSLLPPHFKNVVKIQGHVWL